MAVAACWGQRGNRVCFQLLSLFSLPLQNPFPSSIPTHCNEVGEALFTERASSEVGLGIFQGKFSLDAIQRVDEDKMITVECHQFAAPE